MSCINQLLSITQDIFTSFDNGLEIRVVFLDTSKAFDKVWLHELKQNEIKDKLLCLLIDFPKNHQQRVVLNGQFSSWKKVNAAVPQGPILRTLLLLIFINEDLLTVYSLFQDILLMTLLYFLRYKISPQEVPV